MSKRARIIGLVAVVGVAAGAFGASAWLADKVRNKLITTAAVAGLRVEVDDVAISPLGSLTIKRLRAMRVDDTEAFAVARIEADASLLDVLKGKRRPRSIALHQPRLHTRVVDGQPRELNRWGRVLRSNLRKVQGKRSAASVRTGPRRWPSVKVNGGVVRVDVIGKYAAAAPEGVAVRDIDVAIDATGTGTASASLLSPVQTHWRGKVQPAEDGTPWVSLQADEPLKYGLPDAVAELTGLDAIEIGGGGWTRSTGPYLTNLRALVGSKPATEIGRFSVSLTGLPTAIAAGVIVHPGHWLRDNPRTKLPRWLNGLATAPGSKVEIARVVARRLLAKGGDRVELQLHDGAANVGNGAVRGRARSIQVEAPLEALRKLAAPMIRVRAAGAVATVDADHPLTDTIPVVATIAREWPERVASSAARSEDARHRANSNQAGWPNPTPLPSRSERRKLEREARKKKRAKRRAERRAKRRTARLKRGKRPTVRARLDDSATPLEKAKALLEINLNRAAKAKAKLRAARDTGNSRLIRRAAKAAARWKRIVARYRRNLARKKRAHALASRLAQTAKTAKTNGASNEDGAGKRNSATAPPDDGEDGQEPANDQPIRAKLAAMANEHEPPQPQTDTDKAAEANKSSGKKKSAGSDPAKQRAAVLAARAKRLKAAELPYTKRFVAPLKKLHGKLAIDLDATLVTLADRIAEMPRATVEDATFELVSNGEKSWRLGIVAKQVRIDPRDAIPAAVEADIALEVGQQAGGNVGIAIDRLGSSGRLTWRVDLDRALGPVLAAEEPIGLAPDASLRIDGEAMFGGVGGIRASGRLQSTGIGIDWWRFAPGPVTDMTMDATWQLDASTRPGAIDIALGSVRIGDFELATRVRIHRLKSTPVVDLHVAMPRQDCAAAARSIPRSLLPTTGDIQAVGTIDWWLDLSVNVAHPWFSELAFQLHDKHCRVTSLGRVDVAEIANRFSRKVNEDGKTLDDVKIGPGSGSWASLGEMPRWVPYAMTTTEDGSFWAHRGLNEFLLNRAVRLDLHYGRFVYGGSTLTQQLVKNLYMTRSKFLARKLEELLIVWAMERNVKKARILEVYTNAVEFGPNLYGVKRAAKHYFDKTPSRLTPLEAAFLGSIKPCPRCADFAFRSQSYKPWYQRRVLQILTRMLHYKVISQEQYDREMNTVPRFAGWSSEKLAQRFAWPIPEVNKPTKFDKAKGKKGKRRSRRRGT